MQSGTKKVNIKLVHDYCNSVGISALQSVSMSASSYDMMDCQHNLEQR